MTEMKTVLVGTEVTPKMLDDAAKASIDGALAQVQARKATQLPKPSGYRILCAVPEVEQVTEKGIIKADITVQNEELLTTVLFVVALGPDCYKDATRFPSGPWCKEGDFVLVRPHAGTRVKIHGKEFRMINDDSVEGTVEDPRGYSRF
jgi:co-chaperonin GroES (HSP10)